MTSKEYQKSIKERVERLSEEELKSALLYKMMLLDRMTRGKSLEEECKKAPLIFAKASLSALEDVIGMAEFK